MSQGSSQPAVWKSLPVAIACAVGLTYVFWAGLWHGGGLIGSDTYSYFFPQKAYYAERLADGELPLWNPLVGHGYPMLAESQTGVFYPFNLALYKFLDVNTAYSVSQLIHYALAFLFTWLYCRRFGLSNPASLIAGTAFTYGWFPYRIGLEWAIVTGAWLPAALWCAESFLQTRYWRWAIALAVVLAVQMLAGHFHLAFLTQLVLVLYIPGRLWFAKLEDDVSLRTNASTTPVRSDKATLGLCIAAMVCGFALAAVQLLPTWELKQHSQRANVGSEHDPGYGFMPAWYWSQTVAPWIWYGTGIDLNERLPADSPGTNDIEAHLYFGLLPLALCVFAVLSLHAVKDRRLCLWLILGVAALLYTPGWFMPVTKHLPGFSFFIAPGRFGIITTFAVAVIAAAGFDKLTLSQRTPMRLLAFAAVLAITIADLLWVARQGNSVAIVDDPPINNRDKSEVRKILNEEDRPVRLFCRGPNLATLLGVSSTPTYLGIAPAAYFDPELTMPQPFPFNEPPTAEQIEWLRQAGVTHVLSFSPLETADWPVTLVWRGYDRFLNRAWGHREPFHLYELAGGRGRVSWKDVDHRGSVRVEGRSANSLRIVADSPQPARIVLTELAYPGWSVTVDGEPAEPLVVDGMFRGVDVPPGRHEVVWSFRPRWLSWGIFISASTAVLLSGLAHARYWHPGWFAKGDSTQASD